MLNKDFQMIIKNIRRGFIRPVDINYNSLIGKYSDSELQEFAKYMTEHWVTKLEYCGNCFKLEV